MTDLSNVNDLLSRAGANALCRTIAAYWAKRGHQVRVEPVEFGEDSWGVRSNLVNGWPTPKGRDA